MKPQDESNQFADPNDEFNDPNSDNQDFADGVEGEEQQGSMLDWMQDQFHALPCYVLSFVIHVVLFALAYFFMGQPQTPQAFKIEMNTRLQTEKVEEFKPEPLKNTDLVQTKRTEEVQDENPSVEDPVIREAETSDHNETANEEDYQMAKGDPQAMSDSPLEGKLSNSDIGIGGGAGGMFGDRFGGRENLAKKGGSRQTESAVEIGLQWLKRHQKPNGSWSGKFTDRCGQDPKFTGTCDGEGHGWVDPGLTGLALLCFLGAGNSTMVGTYKDQVKKGTRYLLDIQDESGCFGPQANHYMYNHAICTLAIAEAYTLSDYNPLLKESAQKGVNFLVKAQNPNSAWRYTARCNDNDTSVTGWCVMALKSAKAGGLEVPEQSMQWAKSFLDSMTDDTYYYTGYTARGKQYVNIPECMTAVAMTARVFMGADAKDPYLIGGAGLLQTSLPVWEPQQGEHYPIDYYYWYYGTLAMYQMGGDYWTTWNNKMKETLLAHQCRGGCQDGSWPMEDRWGKDGGGRVYTTAINVLSLEIYYRYAKVFK